MAVGPKVSEWRKLPMSLTELCIDTTLRCGQAFRWRKIDDEWHCTLQGRILSLKQDPTHLYYRATFPSHAAPPLSPPPPTLPSPSPAQDPSPPVDDTLSLLTTYFNLPVSLAALYATWSSSDPNFARRAPSFTGIRILNQPAWEALVAFICSSNNNIARISQMVSKLCLHYGPYIGRAADGEPLHDFPAPHALAADGVEQRLRELGFGYRARYIAQTARTVAERGEAWLVGLRNPLSPALGSPPPPPPPQLAGQSPRTTTTTTPAPAPAAAAGEEDEEDESNRAAASGYKAAHEALLTLSGVGPKVADCVCLMGLGWAEAVPVDTHVWQIAQRDYKFGGGGKPKATFNKALHDAVGDHFRAIWGQYAGWAQSVLFTANLRSFADQAKVRPGKKVEAEEEEEEEEEVVKVEEELVKIEKGEDAPPGLRVRMRVTKRKAVVKTEATGDNGVGLAGDSKVRSTRASKRRRVQA